MVVTRVHIQLPHNKANTSTSTHAYITSQKRNQSILFNIPHLSILPLRIQSNIYGDQVIHLK